MQATSKIGSEKEPIQGTEMQFTIDELKTLAELVYMGYYVANGYRKNCDEEQFRVSSLVYRAYAALKNNFSDREDIEDNEIADVRDELCSDTNSIIEEFERNVFAEKAKEKVDSTS